MDNLWQAGAVLCAMAAFVCLAGALFWFALANFSKDPKVREGASKYLTTAIASLLLVAVVLGIFAGVMTYISTGGGKIQWLADFPLDLGKWLRDIFLSEGGIQVAPLNSEE